MALDKVFEKHPDTVCIVVGEGDGRTRLMKFAATLKLEDKVIFHRCKPMDIHNYYHHCDLFIMPSRFEKTTGNSEGFGVVFMEAALFEKACIGGRSGGVSDVIVDGKTGILVDPTDPNDIAKAINKLLDDPGYARKLGQAARLRVHEEFSRKKILPLIVEILSESSNL
jgi:phosphatidylinositol alpha-1,6-mannosyltransferase